MKKLVPNEKLLGATEGSIYKLAILAAKRAAELSDGEKALIEKPGEKTLDNAIREIAAQKVTMKKAGK